MNRLSLLVIIVTLRSNFKVELSTDVGPAWQQIELRVGTLKVPLEALTCARYKMCSVLLPRECRAANSSLRPRRTVDVANTIPLRQRDIASDATTLD
jgi:hypothetical protein